MAATQPQPSQQLLSGQRVVITGASRGIGRALALGFADHGADLLLIARDMEKLAETRALIAETCPTAQVECYGCDLRDVKQIQSTVQELTTIGPVNVLINNAGMNIRSKSLDVTESEWQSIMDTDLRGAFFMAQQVGRQMVEQGGGSIVNVSSVGGHVALRTGVVYAAAKAGIIQMTKVLALEWGEHNVRVNGIAPWYFRTPLTEKLLDDKDYLADILARTPLRRVGEVNELVGPAVFLASRMSTYVTGHTLMVDGGMTIYGF